MTFRISPLWWPALILASPVLIPLLIFRYYKFKINTRRAEALNGQRTGNAAKLELPELKNFEINVLVEQKKEPGFLSAPGISYWIKTDRGDMLFDIGYGPEDPSLTYNSGKKGFSIDRVDALVISHLHPDHMGGFKAAREKSVNMPETLGIPEGKDCFLPEIAKAEGFKVRLVDRPSLLAAGIYSTGPLARALFLMGLTEEQAIVGRIKGKGLIVLTGCGHPTIEVIIKMIRNMSDEPIYAVGGGLHFPVTDSPLRKPGIKVQMIWGTGKPPWRRITEGDLDRTIAFLNEVHPKYVFLSAHDTCDYSIKKLKDNLMSEVRVLKAGGAYKLV